MEIDNKELFAYLRRFYNGSPSPMEMILTNEEEKNHYTSITTCEWGGYFVWVYPDECSPHSAALAHLGFSSDGNLVFRINYP